MLKNLAIQNRKEAVILCRVSTHYQDYDPQIEELRLFAKSKGYGYLHEIAHKESGFATIKDRAGLEKLIQMCEQNKNIDAVFCTEISRLGRSHRVLLEIRDFFISNKIQLYIKLGNLRLLDEDTRQEDSYGSAMFSFFAMNSESEVKMKKERFLRSRKSNMAKGLSISGKTLFGFKKIKEVGKKSYLIEDEETASQVLQIFQWYAYGLDTESNPSIRRISKECIVRGFHKYTYSKRNINKLLKEEGYLGEKTTNNKRKNPEYEPDKLFPKYLYSNCTIKYPKALVSPELFQRVAKRLVENISASDKSTHNTILSKLIVCHSCGNFLTAEYRTSEGLKKYSYRCHGRSKTIPCENRQSISLTMLDSAIWSVIRSDHELLLQIIERFNPNDELQRIEKYNNLQIETRESLIRKIEEREAKIQRLVNRESWDEAENEKVYLDKQDQELKAIKASIRENSDRINTLRTNHESRRALAEANLEEIEKSQELVQRYVRSFVESVHILQQTTRFSLVVINFLIESEGKQSPTNWENHSEIESKVYVLLDKRETLRIKGIKVTKTIGLTKTNKIFWMFRSNDLTKRIQIQSANFETVYDALQSGNHENLNLSGFKILNFNKLNVYKMTKQLKVNQIDAEKEQL